MQQITALLDNYKPLKWQSNELYYLMEELYVVNIINNPETRSRYIIYHGRYSQLWNVIFAFSQQEVM